MMASPNSWHSSFEWSECAVLCSMERLAHSPRLTQLHTEVPAAGHVAGDSLLIDVSGAMQVTSQVRTGLALRL